MEKQIQVETTKGVKNPEMILCGEEDISLVVSRETFALETLSVAEHWDVRRSLDDHRP